MKKVALLKNDEICYGSLIYFLVHIAETFQHFGVETVVVERIDNAFMEQKWDGVIGINIHTLSVRLDNGDFLFDYLDCPIFALIVDAPYFHDRLLKEHPRNMHLICLDEGHIDYAQEYYGPFKSVEMGYLLGEWQEPVPYEERAIDVLFTGTRSNIEEMRDAALSYPEKWVGELFEFLVQEGKAHPNMLTELQVLRYFSEQGIQISREDCRFAMTSAGVHAEYYLRGYYRELILEELVNAGVPVTVVGNGWNDFAMKHAENLNFNLYQGVDFEETAKWMANAKIVLNVMPWFKDGLHDRIPTSMHNGAICVTDKSSYIEKHFQDDEDIILFDLERLGELSGKIKGLLENPEKAANIAVAGRKKAQKTYTWERLVQDRFLPYIH